MPGTSTQQTPAASFSLADLVVDNASRHPDKVVLSRRDGAGWRDVTAAQFRDEAAALAKGLLASGVGAGDRVLLMSKTRYEWTLCDVAIWMVGGVTVPVYETSSADQVSWILNDSGAVAALVETAGHRLRVESASSGALPLWTFEATTEGQEVAGGLDALVAGGADVPDADLDARRASTRADSLATLIYTSGTTGRPKGCQLTHGNFRAECTAALAALPELFEPEDARTLLFLPLAHVFGRMIQVACLMSATQLAHSDTARLLKDLGTYSPTFVLAVPRVFEKVFDSARRKAVAGGRERIFDLAADTAISYSRALDSGRVSPLLRVRRAIADRLVYAKLRTALGGKVEWAISGGAPLGDRLGHFFRGAGVTVLEGYGLTETTAACTVNTRGDTKIGTVGRAMPGLEVDVANDGEVLIRGGHVFTGYWDDEESTTAVLGADGWFRTGDLGTLDDEGYLTITGRKKEIIVTSAGKNVSPAGLEDAVRSCPLVSQCMVVGDGRASIAALVTLDPEAVTAWLASQGRDDQPVAELVEDAAVKAEVAAAVTRANESVSSAEGIKRFTVLPVDFTEEGGQLTPTMKLKRSVVLTEFAAEVEGLYAPRRG